MVSGIGNQRRSRVGDQGHVFSLLQTLYYAIAPRSFIVLMQRQQGRINAQTAQQVGTVTGIFGRNHIHQAQDFPSPSGKIAAVADGRCHHVQDGFRHKPPLGQSNLNTLLFPVRLSLLQRISRQAGVLASVVLLATACAPVSTEPETPQEPGQPQTEQLSEVERLLQQAEAAPPLSQAEYTLTAVQKLLAQGARQRAQTLLEQLSPELLSSLQRRDYWLLKARLAHDEGAPQATLEHLKQLQLREGSNLADELSAGQRREAASLRTHSLMRLGRGEEASLALIEESGLAPASKQSDYSEQIWRRLLRLEAKTLERLAEGTLEPRVQGWIELARRWRTNENLHRQMVQLHSWHQAWPEHPASVFPPKELSPLMEGLQHAPREIAVLLPQSGPLSPAARAVIEGLVAARFADDWSDPPRLSFHDSSSIDDLASFYDTARLKGADLVIGPLAPARVRKLSALAPLPIPTLALNYVPNASQDPQVTQFGLRVEDEAVQAARAAWQAGHRIALTLTPKTDWGRRARRAFRFQWQSQGGIVAGSASFDSDTDFAKSVAALLSVDDSQARAQALKALVNTELNFEPRRRQDVDLFYMVADTKAARQINPALDFYFAGKLPLYASSHLFNGRAEPELNQDLDGIRFTEMPWMLAEQLPLRAEIGAVRTEVRSRFGQLYALGADAWRLSRLLSTLRQTAGTQVQGLTGQLSYTPDGEIRRQLDWATFSQGKVRPLEAP